MRNPFLGSAAFSYRPEGPRDAAGITRARREREASRPSSETEIFLTRHLREYLKDTGRAHLCQENVFQCDPWTVEPQLLGELRELRQQSEDRNNPDYQQTRKKLHQLRGLLRAGSSLSYDRRPDTTALTAIDSEIRLKDPRWHEIETVFQNQLFGPAVEPAVRHIEDMYGVLMFQWLAGDEKMKHRLRATIDNIREIRDKLYLRLVHPDFAKRTITAVRTARPKSSVET